MVLATKKNCQRVLAAGLRVVSAMTGNPPLTKQRVLAAVAITKKNCLGVFAASMRVISAMTGNPPLVVSCLTCTHICRIKGCGGAGWPPHQ